MIAISESLIRSVRRMSIDDDKDPLSSSPTSAARAQRDIMQSAVPEPPIPVEQPQSEEVPAPAPSSATNVVKFDATVGSPLSPRDNPGAFVKVPVDERKQLFSSLSRELVHSANYRNTRRADKPVSSGPTLMLQVFIEPGKPPMKMKVQGSANVEEVIGLIIRQHAEQKRKPSLPFNKPDAYDLRMVDEDDGTPDTDIPPLERSGDIHKFNVEAVALTLRPDTSMKFAGRSSVEIGGKNFVKVRSRLKLRGTVLWSYFVSCSSACIFV